jgi:hypothetical protein
MSGLPVEMGSANYFEREKLEETVPLSFIHASVSHYLGSSKVVGLPNYPECPSGRNESSNTPYPPRLNQSYQHGLHHDEKSGIQIFSGLTSRRETGPVKCKFMYFVAMGSTSNFEYRVHLGFASTHVISHKLATGKEKSDRSYQKPY